MDTASPDARGTVADTPRLPPAPATRRGDVVEHLHGHEIADPYRWLEDADASEVVDWVERQRDHTEQFLQQLPERAWFQRTLRDIVLRPRAGSVMHLGGRFAVARNDGQQPQNVWFVADAVDELEHGGGRVLLDPNTWSDDGTSSLGALGVSHDHRVLAYAINDAGSDWQRFRFADFDTLEPLDEPELVTKFNGVTFLADHRTFAYNAYEHSERTEGTSTAALGGGRVMLHTLGTPRDADRELVSFDDERDMGWVEASEDDRWLIGTIARGTEASNRLWAWRQEVTDDGVQLEGPVRLVDENVHEWRLIGAVGDTAWVVTTVDAPRGRVVAIDLAASARTGGLVFDEVLPEGDQLGELAVLAGDDLVLEALRDATPVLRRVGRDGVDHGLLEVPGGALVALSGDVDSRQLLVGMSSVTSPTTCWVVDLDAGSASPMRALHLVDAGGIPLPEVTTRRLRVASSDGAEVPYFLIRAVGADPEGPQPTLLYGYGGFKVPVLADHRPIFAGWLAAGGVLAIANLRGGGEFGTDWYEQGRRQHKQQVFDDVIAVAEHLVDTGVTTPAQLALHGRSNGGLLVGAAMTQRPDLFGVALPTVGVLDVLRFHLFTVGAAWISDYGDPAVASDFETALAYSPVHNVRAGVAYPATLVATGDHDDRVVPLHSHKFTAALQHAQVGESPILTRIETATGHGAGKPASMVADEAADLLAFAAHFTGLEVPAS